MASSDTSRNSSSKGSPPSSLAEVIAFLSEPPTTPPISDADFRQLQERYDVMVIPRGDVNSMVPLMASVLADQAVQVTPRDEDNWLLVREPVPDGSMTLDQVLAARPDALPDVLIGTLEALHQLHNRGVILNEGARADMQYLTPDPPQFLIGWRTEWASVWAAGTSDSPSGSPSPSRSPQLLCATGDPCAHYPVRDLLWFLSPLPREFPLGALGEMLVVVAMRRDQDPELPSIFALAPLKLLRALDLPQGWEGHATPVGGERVSVLDSQGPPELVRVGWAVQQCAAAGHAFLRGGSEWAREDLRDALREIVTSDRSGLHPRNPPAVVIRSLGGDCRLPFGLGQSGGCRHPSGSASFQTIAIGVNVPPAAVVGDGFPGEVLRVDESAADSPSLDAPQEQDEGDTEVSQGARDLLGMLLANRKREQEQQQDDGARDEDDQQPVGELRSVLDLFGALDMADDQGEGEELNEGEDGVGDGEPEYLSDGEPEDDEGEREREGDSDEGEPEDSEGGREDSESGEQP